MEPVTPEAADRTPAPSPAQMLALVREQQARDRERLAIDPVVLYGAWGVAWLVGFGLFYLGSGERPIVPLPYALTLAVFLGLLAAAGAVTAVHIGRVTRGIRGESARAGALHGWTWLAGFVGLGAINGAVAHLGVSPHVMTILATCGSGLVVGVIYMASGAAWGQHAMFGLGAWFVVVAAGAAFAGLPGTYLVMSLAGGGGFLAVTGRLLLARRTR